MVVPKYFLQIPICELHSDLIKPAQDGGLTEARDDNGKVIISDSKICKLIPPNVKPMSKQRRILCGYKICVSADILQHSINAWRTKHLKRLKDIMNARRRSRSSIKLLKDTTNTRMMHFHKDFLCIEKHLKQHFQPCVHFLWKTLIFLTGIVY